jgi:hypothetical protein
LEEDTFAEVPAATEHVLTIDRPKVDEAAAFDLVPTDERRCPGCGQGLLPDAVLCVACGFDLKAGTKRVRTEFQPVERRWEAGWPFRRRLTFFILLQAVIVPLATLGAVLDRAFFPFFIPWLMFSVLLAFLLGTYERVDLTRNERGRVALSKTWRVCFIERAAEKLKLSSYYGIRTMATYGVNGLDLALLVFLGVFACLPAILWWFFNLNRVTYHVALTGEFGHAEMRLCTTKNEEQARDLSETIHSVCGLPSRGW